MRYHRECELIMTGILNLLVGGKPNTINIDYLVLAGGGGGLKAHAPLVDSSTGGMMDLRFSL